MKQYIKFTESNDWEAETWNFYVPSDHPKLAEAIEKAKKTDGWKVSDKPVDEAEVDRRCSMESHTTYMHAHNKVKDVDLTKEFYKGKPFEDTSHGTP